MTGKKQPSIDWRRIYALPYDHFFKDRVIESRLSLGLPRDGIADNLQAREWLHNHLSLKKPFLPHIDVIPLWIALCASPTEESLRQTNVPLWQNAVTLADESRLPIMMRNYIGIYILTNNAQLLTSWKGLGIIPKWKKEGKKLKLSITIDGIDEWTTKEEWLQVWDNWVQGLFEQIPRGKRHGRGDEAQERIKRYAEWYELSEQPNSGPAKALKQWEGQHENERGKYDISTLAKAVKEFRNLITPSD